MVDSPFIGPGGEPRLIDCAVLYFDLLGVSAMAQGQAAESELVRFDSTIRGVFPYPIGAAAAVEAESERGAYPATVFSDSVVQAVPISEEVGAAGPIFQTVIDVAQLQSELATRRYFARGAITLDKFHCYDGLLFGPALVEAVGLERRIAIVPRIVLSPAVAEALLHAGAADGAERSFYEEVPVLVDEDGVAFVDYLTGALQADPEVELPVRLHAHRDVVMALLRDHMTDFGRWSKYRWVAEYHNAVCATQREVLADHGGFETFLIDLIYTQRRFRPLVPAGQN
jgi:hypothetical protein